MRKSAMQFAPAFLMAVICMAMAARGQENNTPPPPDPRQYVPCVFVNKELENYRITGFDTEIWRDGKMSGIPTREWAFGLPDHCWGIKYTFNWNDESPSPNHVPGTPDPEPVIVFVSDDGRVVGVQSRVHGQWPPINTSLSSLDFKGGSHIKVGFAANVHTPGTGAVGALVVVDLVGNLFADLAAAVRTLDDLIARGVVLEIHP